MKHLSFLVRSIVEKIRGKNALDKALDEVKHGKILKYNSFEDLIKDI